MYQSSGPHPGPPPICFNCSKEGHFVVDCPEPKWTSVGGPPPRAPETNPSTANYPGSQPPRWGNGKNTGAPGAIVTQYPKAPPVVTRYALPGQSSHYGNSPGSYVPPSTALPYQYPGSAPPAETYPPPSQGPYPPSQYAAAPPYSQHPRTHSYSAPPPNAQYAQGYQAPPQPQHSPFNIPSQYTGSPAQQYGPPPSQHQSPVSQYPSRNGSYNGHGTPWNNTTPVSASSPFHAPPQQQPNGQRRGSSSQREYSGTPSQQSQPPPHRTPQNGYAQVSGDHQQTPQTPVPSFNPNPAADPPQGSLGNGSFFPPKSASPSVASSRASTPYRRYGSISNASGKKVTQELLSRSRSATADLHIVEPTFLTDEVALEEGVKEVAKKEGEEGEEGEYTEEDLLHEQFNWDYKKIFKRPEETENVALSQPLSYTYNVTPVPLMDPRWTGSVSRYARKDNLKDYLKPIRSQPQWDYLKEDPAFSDVDLEGPLVPLKEVRTWMVQRQRVDEDPQVTEEIDEETMEDLVEMPADPSRKRTWSNEQEDVDSQIQLEAPIEEAEVNPSKRQKNDHNVGDDTVIADIPGTPIIVRAGTPTFGVADDAWAPEPGEVASAPMDPTEALLASLGVSGAPKPVREDSNPPTVLSNEEQYGTPPFGSIPHSMSPQAQAPADSTPHKKPPQNMPSQGVQGAPQEPPQNDPAYGNPQYNAPQQGSPSNRNPYGAPPPQPNVPYNNQDMPAYNNSMPPQQTAAYGPPQQYGAPYGNPPAPHRQPSYGNYQYGPPQGQYGAPPNQYPPQAQYNGPSNSHYGPPQPQWNGPPQSQYGPPQVQYSGPPNGQYGPPQGYYAGPPQGQYGPPPVQYGYGPPQGQYNNLYPPPNQGPPPYSNPAYGQPQGQPVTYPNGPQQGNPPYQQFNNQNQGNQPPRQDSGYASARGSYSNGSAPNGFGNGGPHQNQPSQQRLQQVNGDNHTAKQSVYETNGESSHNNHVPKKIEIESKVDEKPTAIEPVESPLSPTSAEILGKLTQPAKPRRIVRVISGKNKDANRTADDPSPKKLKRAAPVVAEAYSRRW